MTIYNWQAVDVRIAERNIRIMFCLCAVMTVVPDDDDVVTC